MVEVKVKGIVSERPSTRYALILEDGNHRVLSVFIGRPEAQAVVLALKKVRFAPPLIYDFIFSCFTEMSVKPIRMEIIAHRNESYYVQFIIQAGERLKYIECRPSDGVALALCCGVPILVQDELMKTAAPIAVSRRRKEKPAHRPPLTYAESDEIKEAIEDLSAEDFWRRIKT